MSALNRRGQTISERIAEEFNYIKTVGDSERRKVLAYKALGAADIAIEFGLISYTDWERYVKEFFKVS